MPPLFPINSNPFADFDTASHAWAGSLAPITRQLIELHEHIQSQVRILNLDLYSIDPDEPVQMTSVSTPRNNYSLAIGFRRRPSEAVTVERLMGREEIANLHNTDPRRHPVIEIRVQERWFVVELVISPDAWWDQQNLLGKNSIERHFHHFHRLLRNLPPAYRLGFWRGCHLSELHLEGKYYAHTRVLDEWMSTFEPNLDWFRLGIWFEHAQLAEHNLDALHTQTMAHIRHLYPIYDYLVWSSDNNYRDFFKPARTE